MGGDVLGEYMRLIGARPLASGETAPGGDGTPAPGPDRIGGPAVEHLPAAVQAAETLRAVRADVSEILSRLPQLPPGEMGAAAAKLDELAGETRQAAAMLRGL